jgi:nucleoside-diphosphate-sugar epimerase
VRLPPGIAGPHGHVPGQAQSRNCVFGERDEARFVAEILEQRERAAGGDDRAVPLAAVGRARRRQPQGPVSCLERRQEQRLRPRIGTRGRVATQTSQRAFHDVGEEPSVRCQASRTKLAHAPLAVGELVPGQRPADRLVVADEPLLLRVEGTERELRQRLRPRLRLRTLLPMTAAGEQRRRQERAGAPVDSAAMRVLVTGASGFVGRALIEELRHGGRAYEVYALERREGDLADEGIAEQAIAESEPDVVVHAAARIGIEPSETEPFLALRSNVLATVLVARAAARHNARLAYVSTADVSQPASLYALSKLWGEQTALHYAPAGLVILRLANPYGPGSRGALPTMLRQAAHGEVVPAFRGETRSWLWIGDAARAIRLILESGEGGIFDVASDQPAVTLPEAARLACELAGASADLVEERDPPPGRVVPRVDIDRLRALGWQPEVSLEEGLRLTLQSLQAAAAV